MSIGSGLGSQFMFAAESTVGTAVTVTKSLEHIDESLQWKPTWIESVGIKAGLTIGRASRVTQSRFTVDGDVTLEALDKGFGLLIKQALGSSATPAAVGGTAAYRQIHQLGDITGKSLTIQVGRPQPDGTVRAHTYRGCKIVSWEFSCSDGENGKWKFTFDGWQEATATALASTAYLTSTQPFTFAEASISIGGTASFSSGEMIITAPTTLTTLCKGITIKGENPLAVDRYGLGNAGTKAEQIQNGFSKISVDLDGEYTSQSEIYTHFKAGTTKALQVVFLHGNAGGGNPYTLEFTLPACKIKEAAPNVTGPDIVQQKIMLDAYDPEITSCTALQIAITEVATSL